MLMSTRLERDIATPASQSFMVLAIELDSGPVFLAGQRATLGDDRLHPAVLSVGEVSTGGFSVELEQQALPDYADGWWINRAAALIECTPDMESVYDGLIRFDGRIEAEPSEQAGVMSFAVAPYRKIVKTLPGLGLITATDWPLASDSAMGAVKPMIFGTVDDCPLLAVQVQPNTTLTDAASPADAQLAVADATALDAAGSVVVDGHTYTYTSRTDTLLLGMTISAGHRPGTLVAQAGSNVYLAAGEAVSAIDTLRADGQLIEGGTVSLSAATVTYTAPPSVVASAERYTRFEQFDALATGNTATNGVNAIRAVINTYTQLGTPTGTITNATENGGVTFSRPADGNRIISGTYAVQFSVAVGTQVGWARVKIGGDVVWYYEPGVGVLYNNSPAAVTFDDDADLLPVVVEVAEGGSTNQVTVTIVAASRLILTGNLGDANYATVGNGQALKVKQTGVLADMGPIASVKLGVRWFKTDDAIGTTAVTFAGRALGPLKVTQTGGASLNQTIAVNSVTQGAASLPSQPISTTVSGGTASLSHSSVAFKYTISAPMTTFVVAGGWGTIFTGTGDFSGWDFASLGAIQVSIVYQATSLIDASSKAAEQIVEFYSGSTALSASDGGWATIVDGKAYERTMTLSVAPTAIRWRYVPSAFTATTTYRWTSLTSVTFSYNSKITQGAAVLSSTAASGSSAALAAQALANSGIAVSLSGGAVQITVPAPPRMTDTLYDLPWITTWAALTDAIAEIALTGSGASLAICQVWLQIEYDVQTLGAAQQITATVTGRSGNPADVIQTLAEASGETVAIADQARLAAWCTASSMAFARRLSDPADALQLLTFAAEQAACDLYPGTDGLIMRRWDDEACPITAVADAYLLGVATVAWAERVETDITLAYREDYATGNGMVRVVQANAANDITCAQTDAAMQATTPVQLDGGWLRADASAALLLAAYVRRYAVMRRVTTLDLPYTFGTVEAGDLIDWRDSFWRVLAAPTDNGWQSLALEERPVS